MVRITGPCRTCRFYNPLSETEGECRHSAPRIVVNGAGNSYTEWPIVKLADWCGDWARDMKPSKATKEA